MTADVFLLPIRFFQMTLPPTNRLLIIGWDAADWIIIDRLFAQGKMPNLRRLVEAGVRADLATLDPKLSPMLWSSIATGKTADKHGILNFVEPNPTGDGLRVSSSTTRRTKALWNILTQSNMKINAVSWYASHPAEPISGTCVTNLFQDGAPSSVHPESLAAPLAPLRVEARDIPRAQLKSMIPRLHELKPSDDRPNKLAKQLARMSSVHGVAMSVLRDAPEWNCTMVFYETIDTIGHHFMEYLPPKMSHISKHDMNLFGEVMPKVYEHHDKCLGELLDAAGAGTTVMLLSDHGFHSGDQRPTITQIDPNDRAALEASWHRPFGVLVLSGPGIKKGEKIAPPTLLDITPTALALLGLPIAADMDGRVLAEAFAKPYTLETIESWETRPGDAGLHPDELRNNPFESHDALNQLIDLGYMPALGDDLKAQLALVRRETNFNLAVVYMSTRRPLLAIPLFTALAQQYPAESRFAVNLGNCQIGIGEFAACEQTASEFLKQHPTHVEARLLRIGALAKLLRTEESVSQLAQLERELRGRNDLAFALGDLHAILQQWSDASRCYKQAQVHDPQNPRVQVALARTCVATAKWDDAIEHCLNAVELKQHTPEAHDYLGVALAWAGDAPHAIQSFENAIAMQPGLIDAHRFIVLLAARGGDTARADIHRHRVRQLLLANHGKAIESFAWGPNAWATSVGIPPVD